MKKFFTESPGLVYTITLGILAVSAAMLFQQMTISWMDKHAITVTATGEIVSEDNDIAVVRFDNLRVEKRRPNTAVGEIGFDFNFEGTYSFQEDFLKEKGVGEDVSLSYIIVNHYVRNFPDIEHDVSYHIKQALETEAIKI